MFTPPAVVATAAGIAATGAVAAAAVPVRGSVVKAQVVVVASSNLSAAGGKVISVTFCFFHVGTVHQNEWLSWFVRMGLVWWVQTVRRVNVSVDGVLVGGVSEQVSWLLGFQIQHGNYHANQFSSCRHRHAGYLMIIK